MKALVKSKSEPGLWLDDIEAPRPGINDVLIRVKRAGICGTDVHIYKWVGSSRVDLQACKLEYSIVSPK